MGAQLAPEINGQTAFGGTAAQTRKDVWRRHIVPEDVNLTPGGYRMTLRAAPLVSFNLNDLAIECIVDYRRPGVEGWKNVSEIMTSNEARNADQNDDWHPIQGDIQVTRAGAYSEHCEYSVLADAFVNPETTTKGTEITLPVGACELVTVDLTYDPGEAGDHYIMPYLDSGRCITSLTYIEGATATQARAIPSPAAQDLGLNGAKTAFSDPYGHLPLTNDQLVDIQVRAMCREDADLTIFAKRPGVALMQPW